MACMDVDPALANVPTPARSEMSADLAWGLTTPAESDGPGPAAASTG